MSGAPWSSADTEHLRSLASAGLSLVEIAARMKRSKNAVRDWAEKLNIAIAKARHPKQQEMRLAAARLHRVETVERKKT
jgi:transposase